MRSWLIVGGLVIAGWTAAAHAAPAPPLAKPEPALTADAAAWRLEIVKPAPAGDGAAAAAIQLNGKDVAAVQACKDTAMKGHSFVSKPGEQGPHYDPKNAASPALQELAYQINSCLKAGGQSVSVVATPDPVFAKFLR